MPNYLSDLPKLAEYVEFVESSGNPNAVSYSGAVGLMGIKPMTAAGPGSGVTALRPAELYDPDKNRKFGEEYLAKMLNHYKGNAGYAILGYGWGMGNTDKWLKSGGDINKLPPDKRNYMEGFAGTGVHADEFKKAKASGWTRYHAKNRAPAKPNPEAVAEINSLYSEGPSGQGIGAQQAVTREQAWSKANEFLDKSKP